MCDEVLDLFAGRITQNLDRAEVDGICLDQVRIELMLADDLAKAVAELRAVVVPVAIGRPR
jgi:hypothetical protein